MKGFVHLVPDGDNKNCN